MRRSRFPAVSAVVAAMALLFPAAALADCKMLQLAELATDPRYAVPVVDGQINGVPAKLMLDTGSSLTMLIRSEAEKRGLALGSVAGVTLYGIGGHRDAYGTSLKSLAIGPLVAKNLDVIASGPREGASDVAVIVGDDLLSHYDVEFDMANHVVRIFKSAGCAPDQMVYWGKAYAQTSLLETDRDSPSVRPFVTLNGRQVAALLDSGASTSVVDEPTAEGLGVQFDEAVSSGVLRGLGPDPRPVVMGLFTKFSIGDEQMANVRIETVKLSSDMSDTEIGSRIPHSLNGDSPPTMLIGADFLHAHRVLVANLEHVMIFSYNGGPVFARRKPPAADSKDGH